MCEDLETEVARTTYRTARMLACGPPEGGHPVRLLSPGDKVDLNVLYLVGGGDGSCTETHPQAAPW
jgi:hypothetical protein